jgi:hypothetical protein
VTTIDELQDAMTAAIATGKIGTPVALRVHAIVTSDSFNPAATLDAVIGLAGTAFPTKPQRLTARSAGAGQQWNVLLNYAGGQTLSFSIASNPDRSAGNCLHLLLIGNHGIVRLEGAELLDDCSGESPENVVYWKQHMTDSHAKQTVVHLS